MNSHACGGRRQAAQRQKNRLPDDTRRAEAPSVVSRSGQTTRLAPKASNSRAGAVEREGGDEDGSTAGAPSIGRRVRRQGPSRWSRRRSAQPRAHARPQPERLSPNPPTQGQTVCPPPKRQGNPAGLW